MNRHLHVANPCHTRVGLRHRPSMEPHFVVSPSSGPCRLALHTTEPTAAPATCQHTPPGVCQPNPLVQPLQLVPLQHDAEFSVTWLPPCSTEPPPPPPLTHQTATPRPRPAARCGPLPHRPRAQRPRGRKRCAAAAALCVPHRVRAEEDAPVEAAAAQAAGGGPQVGVVVAVSQHNAGSEPEALKVSINSLDPDSVEHEMPTPHFYSGR